MKENNEILEGELITKPNVPKEEENTKPSLEIEIKDEVTALGKIEDNIEEVKNRALELKEYYSNPEQKFNENEIKSAKDERAKVNTFKDQVSKFKKEIIEKYNEPIEKFKNTAAEAVSILKETYNVIDNQVKKYENDLKLDLQEKIESYFDEVVISKHLDFLSFDEIGLTFTVSDCPVKKDGERSITKPTKKIDEFISRIESDMVAIENMQYSEEIELEYRKHRNLGQAINDVKNRHLALDCLKETNRRREEIIHTEDEKSKRIDETLSAPVEEPVYTEKPVNEQTFENTVDLFEFTFKVTGSLEKLKELNNFLKEGGYTYEQCE